MTTRNDNNRELNSPERINYFYGQLLDVVSLNKEQRYFNHKRWLLNRLVLGCGVVCGLDVVAVPEPAGFVRIQPGVAIDGLGREIIVPAAVPVNPHYLTDEYGHPSGDLLDDGTVVELCLAYAERETDPVPVLVPDCDTPGNCACSTIREEFVILVRPAGDAPQPPACDLTGFPLPVNGDLHALLCERVNELDCAAPTELCVPLARIQLPLEGDSSIDATLPRRLVYSNALIHELILCLAGRVADLAGSRILRYVAGDGQMGQPGEQLRRPLRVELVDLAGNPVTGALVKFEASAEGNMVPASTSTNKKGRASSKWTLDPGEGRQHATARAVGTVFTVRFQATAEAVEPD